uniref:Secreted protein n=1 Tax=Schistosoma curassoni TaxID=6186 RepID=A0A183KM29_9TREM
MLPIYVLTGIFSLTINKFFKPKRPIGRSLVFKRDSSASYDAKTGLWSLTSKTVILIKTDEDKRGFPLSNAIAVTRPINFPGGEFSSAINCLGFNSNAGGSSLTSNTHLM